MIFKYIVTSTLTATMAIAAPAFQLQTRANSGITVTLTAHLVKPFIQYTNVNSTGVIVDGDYLFDNVLVSRVCPEVCIPEFNCQLYNKNLEPTLVVGPGSTALNSIEIGKVECGLFPESPAQSES
jgi:hypothetical protein